MKRSCVFIVLLGRLALSVFAGGQTAGIESVTGDRHRSAMDIKAQRPADEGAKHDHPLTTSPWISGPPLRMLKMFSLAR